MNYYYYGFVQVAALAKLTAIPPAIAYNLAIPTLAALSARRSFSAGSGPRVDALAGAAVGRCSSHRRLRCSSRVLGNLGELHVLRSALSRDALPIDWWFWNPTRVIHPGEGEPGPITEFPAFTFIFGDLHAHAMALPLAALALALVVAHRAGRATERPHGCASPSRRSRPRAGNALGHEYVGPSDLRAPGAASASAIAFSATVFRGGASLEFLALASPRCSPSRVCRVPSVPAPLLVRVRRLSALGGTTDAASSTTSWSTALPLRDRLRRSSSRSRRAADLGGSLARRGLRPPAASLGTDISSAFGCSSHAGACVGGGPLPQLRRSSRRRRLACALAAQWPAAVALPVAALAALAWPVRAHGRRACTTERCGGCSSSSSWWDSG